MNWWSQLGSNPCKLHEHIRARIANWEARHRNRNYANDNDRNAGRKIPHESTSREAPQPKTMASIQAEKIAEDQIKTAVAYSIASSQELLRSQTFIKTIIRVGHIETLRTDITLGMVVSSKIVPEAIIDKEHIKIVLEDIIQIWMVIQ